MRKAFTLIELLVVIAIIAILAAILFPVFAQAKESAKKSACLSHQKQMGTAIVMYLSDYDDMMPSAYYYRNDQSNADNGSGVCGYVHWSGAVQPYVKNMSMFVCGSDPARGLAPTNFTGNNAPPLQVTDPTGCTTMDDTQAPRLSYIANSLVMPRKRRAADPMNVVSQTALDDIAGTILIAEMTDSPSCINDSSVASGSAYKTHRPANAIKVNTGSGWMRFQGEDPTEIGASYMAVSVQEAKTRWAECRTGAGTPATNYHIGYIQPDRHNGGSNYTYTDTHAKYQKPEATLNPANFQWGKRAYTAGGGVIYKPGTSDPVQ